MITVIVDAADVGDSAGCIGIIAIGAAILSNFYGQLVVLRDSLDDVVQTTGIDLPTDFGERAVFAHFGCEAHRLVRDFGRRRVVGGRDESTEVIVDANVVERSGHTLFVAALEAHDLERSPVDEGIGITAAERCFEEPDVVESVEAFSRSGVFGRRGSRSCGGHAEGAAYV